MTLEQYKTIINAYLDFYPDDRIDIRFNDDTLQKALEDDAEGKEITKDILDDIDTSTDILHIYIYYPSLTLTNDSGKQHTIYDVYVEIIFPSFSIYMGRTTYTKEEVKVGYRHSHISQGNFEQLSSFCTGNNSTPINIIINKYSNRNFNSFETLIQSFIIEVERLIRIESNAGGPYISFNGVGKISEASPIKVEKDTTPDYCSNREKALLIKFIDYYCGLYIDDFYYDGKNWQLAATDAEFIKRVTKVAKTWKKTKNANFYQKVNIIHDLYYMPVPDGNYYMYEGERVHWRFKDKYPRLKVIDNKEDKVKSDYIVRINYISVLYTFMLNLINGVYANQDEYKDSIHSRAYKIKTALIKAM